MPSGSKTTDADSCISHTKYILKRREEHYYTVTDVTLWLLHSTMFFVVPLGQLEQLTSLLLLLNPSVLITSLLLGLSYSVTIISITLLKIIVNYINMQKKMYKIYVYSLANIKLPVLLLPSGPKTGHCQRPSFSSYLQLTLSSSKSNYHTDFHGSHFLDFSS